MAISDRKLYLIFIGPLMLGAFAGVKKFTMGGSPGLVVMGGDSRSKGRGFESRRQILDGHDIFSH